MKVWIYKGARVKKSRIKTHLHSVSKGLSFVGVTPTSWGANVVKDPALTAYRLQITWGKITRHCGLGDRGPPGSWLIGDEVKVMNHFFKFRGQFRGLYGCPSVWFYGEVVRELFHLKAQELKHNVGQDIIFSLSEVPTVWPLVRSVPATVFCCFEGWWLRGIEEGQVSEGWRERNDF